MADNFRFVVGVNQTEAPEQFKINPKLQRTRAEGNRQGLKLANYIETFPVEADGIIRLKNRAVPLNNKFRPLVRTQKRDIIGGLDVPNPPALTKPNEGKGIVNKVGVLKKRG